MRVLAIETASEACSIALSDAEGVIARDHRVLGRGHAEQLVPMIAALPDKGRAERIIVSLGPGSFTGVRVGLAAARALGVAWKAEVLGYPTLSLVAHAALHRETGPVSVCMNGGHGEWFFQNFAADGCPQDAARSLTPEQTRAADVHRVIAGNRASECAALFADDRTVLELLPDARDAHRLGPDRFTRDLRPIYGRAPDATPQKAAAAS
ncbi:MAG: tRNA (adenosine(37)-N6)-threonylcarbamoyltransferase complex dimerization subunit type 1 TsaB [Erythrobacter sp.]|uniref:tRNA (adenosine(37)-N6)-threonylcarbamoyltransferase complex dimerization subunit type 1 TsaB n=1 Tax=Erythrobacter sp. TaxID=1042 RepID=UPI002601EA05|nr:tRNA (adenosine(37)-N6)-threonylcarbamoyltransferase complex dimerization subunit type 1 TsaB [Erythrobacter sp.]MDJ0978854.1 tRNA (adenosine(37)-N6)-threonylcarbamoyltransferase complex dimerization subunit type 1 TsaB [Erythrobacter sp.]